MDCLYELEPYGVACLVSDIEKEYRGKFSNEMY
jgi:hypothetical protein